MDDELEIKAYYAGHVLGAAMFQIKVGSESVVYTVSGGWPWGASWACHALFIAISFTGRLQHDP